MHFQPGEIIWVGTWPNGVINDELVGFGTTSMHYQPGEIIYIGGDMAKWGNYGRVGWFGTTSMHFQPGEII